MLTFLPHHPLMYSIQQTVEWANCIKSCSKANNNNSKQAQSSYLCGASLGLSICRSVCSTLHRQTMFSYSTPSILIPPYDTTERVWWRNCKDTMCCNVRVWGRWGWLTAIITCWRYGGKAALKQLQHDWRQQQSCQKPNRVRKEREAAGKVSDNQAERETDGDKRTDIWWGR